MFDKSHSSFTNHIAVLQARVRIKEVEEMIEEILKVHTKFTQVYLDKRSKIFWVDFFKSVLNRTYWRQNIA